MSRLYTITIQSSGFEDDLVWCTSDEPPIPNPDPSLIQCLYYQVEEAPKTGKIHIQGFVVTKKRCRFNTIKLLFPRAHIERARGNQEQNILYCSKSDTKIKGPFQLGELMKPGESKAFKFICEKIIEGKDFKDYIPDYPDIVARHYRQLEYLRDLTLTEPPVYRHLEVYWYWGKTGTGKTRTCYEQDPNLYVVRNNGLWWDGYTNQEAILFDEFYGDIKCKDMLNYLDGYKLPLPVKGSFTQARWTRVYITSNVSPDQVYNCVPLDVKEAFLRRINNIKYFE